jgi:hypothetical protein
MSITFIDVQLMIRFRNLHLQVNALQIYTYYWIYMKSIQQIYNSEYSI